MTEFVKKSSQAIAKIAAKYKVQFNRTGSSNVSESEYFEIKFPKVICHEFGVLESHIIEIRISEHNNGRTFTSSDLRVNIMSESDLVNAIYEIEIYIENSKCVVEE